MNLESGLRECHSEGKKPQQTGEPLLSSGPRAGMTVHGVPAEVCDEGVCSDPAAGRCEAGPLPGASPPTRFLPEGSVTARLWCRLG